MHTAYTYRKQFYPKLMVPMESRDSEGVPFASLESLWPGILQIQALKGAEKWSRHSRDHHENWKFACRKIHQFQKMLFFSIYDEK